MVPRPKPFEDEQISPISPHVDRSRGPSVDGMECVPLAACLDETTSTQDTTLSTEPELLLTVFGVYGQYKDHPLYCSKKSPGMLRYRLNLTDPDGEGYEKALFVPIDGLTAEDGPHDFWHIDCDENEMKAKIGERAVLFQSMEVYETFNKHDKFKSYFHLEDKKDELSEDKPLTFSLQTLLRERISEDPRFGEQIIVEGATPKNICVGDIFEVEGGLSALKFQVTSPRKPCWYLDKKNNTPRGAKGIKCYCQSRGLGGWFTSVLVKGELVDGMKLVRTAHPHPKLNLETISQALFGGEGDPNAVNRGAASWGRSQEELQELNDMAALADYEWKEEIVELMVEEKEKAKKEEQAKCFDPCACTSFAAFESIQNTLHDMFDAIRLGPTLGCF